jgi:hypothetical protein
MTQAAQLAQYGANNVSLSFKNRIINGNMRIDQRNNGALVAGGTGNTYAVDRTLIGVFGSGTGRISGQRSSTVPSSTDFKSSLIATVTTADASPVDAYGYCLRQIIEGFNVADFGFGTANASRITLSFWARSSIAGTYAVSFQNVDVTRAYVATYTISSANTWEFKTISIPGDTAGSWETSNGGGLSVLWCLGGSTDRQAPSGSIGAWGAGTPVGYTITDAAGCVDWIATSGATFYLTGVQLEKGSTATSFEVRDYGRELMLCQRYYETGTLYAQAYGNGSNGVNWSYPMKVSKRETPTGTLTNGGYVNYSPAFAADDANTVYLTNTAAPSTGFVRAIVTFNIIAEF